MSTYKLSAFHDMPSFC